MQSRILLLLVLMLGMISRPFAAEPPRTRVAIAQGRWQLNGKVTYPGAKAEGLLMNLRAVNAVFEDANDQTWPKAFDAEANTDAFIAKIPDYMGHGIRAFTLSLQGGHCGYEGAVNSAFNPDGSLRESYLKRVRRVIEACDRHGAVVILGCYYQRQDQILKDDAALRAGVVNVAKWIEACGFTNVMLEIANEFAHGGYRHQLLKSAAGEAGLIALAKQTAPGLLVSTSGMGSGRLPEELALAGDFLLVHFNTTKLEDVPARITDLKKYGKPIVCNEDDKVGEDGVKAAESCVANGASWGFMHSEANQYFPKLSFNGTADDPPVYAALKRLTTAKAPKSARQSEGASTPSGSVPLVAGRLLVNLFMEGRLAWFSWMGEQQHKPRLVVEYSLAGKPLVKTYQHGLDDCLYPQAIYLRRGSEPGGVQWDSHAQLGATREGHKHQFFSKDSPPRVAFLKADISDIPKQAVIVKAQLILHIHNTEGLKQVPGADGTGQFRHLKQDWDWDHITFTHCAEGKAWSTPRATYPYLGEDDLGPVLFSLHRQIDLAAKGYHKNSNRDYPLDLTDYVRNLQMARTSAATVTDDTRKPATYFPPPDVAGGWRTAKDADEVRRFAGMDKRRLDEAFDFIKGSTKHGGLLVLRRGWLVHEDYFGLGHRDATPNLASCGKSFTSIAVGILMAGRPELFPDGLDQKVFTPRYFPAETFPLSDPRKQDIKLGQLLAFTAGIRGNNPAYVNGKATTINPVGPDGWQAKVDAIALGKQDGVTGNTPFSTATLWCNPGEGYSYASSSIHLASVMLRHITGMELQDYVDRQLAKPLGWGRWGYGYKDHPQVAHTPGGGGIALRATDMLRFGYLLLHQGRWDNQQIVPADYVRRCASQSPYNPHFPYSLQFNVNTDGNIPELPRDAFWKSGSGGHALYVVPSLDLVVWKLGGRDDQYSPRNTGLAPSPASTEQVAARNAWKEIAEKEAALRKTLAMVIQAIEP